MKTLSAVIFIITATLTGCAHTGYHDNDGGYGYGGGYGSGYTVERYYGSPSYNYYYLPQRSYRNHGHDHDREDEWRHHHQHRPVIDRHDVEPRTRPRGGGDRIEHHDGQQRDGNPDFNRPQRNEGQKRQAQWGDSSEGGRRGRRSDGNPKRDDDGHLGRRRD